MTVRYHQAYTITRIACISAIIVRFKYVRCNFHLLDLLKSNFSRPCSKHLRKVNRSQDDFH